MVGPPLLRGGRYIWTSAFGVSLPAFTNPCIWRSRLCTGPCAWWQVISCGLTSDSSERGVGHEAGGHSHPSMCEVWNEGVGGVKQAGTHMQ